MAATINLDGRETVIEIRVRQPESQPHPSFHPRIRELTDNEPSTAGQVPGGWPELPPPRRRQRVARNTSSASRASRLSRSLSVSSEVFHDAIEAQGWGAKGLGMDHATMSGGLRASTVQEGPRSESDDGGGHGPPRELPEGPPQEPPQEPPQKIRYGPRIWMLMLALCVTNLLVALEGTVISTALPTIVQDLGGGEAYVWASTGYFLTK